MHRARKYNELPFANKESLELLGADTSNVEHFWDFLISKHESINVRYKGGFTLNQQCLNHLRQSSPQFLFPILDHPFQHCQKKTPIQSPEAQPGILSLSPCLFFSHTKKEEKKYFISNWIAKNVLTKRVKKDLLSGKTFLNILKLINLKLFLKLK